MNTCEQLLDKSHKCNMDIWRFRFLCIEIYKTLNDLNPSFIKQIFEKKDGNWVTQDRYKLNLNIRRRNQVMFGIKTLYMYIHTYIHTYIHSYIHTYIHTILQMFFSLIKETFNGCYIELDPRCTFFRLIIYSPLCNSQSKASTLLMIPHTTLFSYITLSLT